MTQQQYIIRRKLNIVDLAETLGNISKACKNLGVSRQHYYDIKGAIEEDGINGLLEKSRSKPRLGNRLSPEIEEKILDYSLHEPTHGQVRVANELKQEGIIVSPGGIRSVWMRNKLQTKALRLKRLEEWARKEENILSESQVQALESAKEEKMAHGEVETYHPGFLVGQDTYYVGYIKGVGKIYQQTGIDTFCNVGFAKLYLDKTSITATDFLNSTVLPFYDEKQMTVLRMLTDRGSEYCGALEKHPFQLFLHLNDIEHSKTKAYHPQTNGATERLNQIIQDEFYKVAFRKKVYTTLEEIQIDLDEYMDKYNNRRTNQGKRCKGRTPMQTLEDGYELYQRYVLDGEPLEICETNFKDRPSQEAPEEPLPSLADEAPKTLSNFQNTEKEVTNQI